MGCFVELQAEVIVNLLNELNDENEELKQQNYKLIRLIEDLGHEEMERQMGEILND